MDCHEFVAPSDADMLDTLGVSPEAAEDEPSVRLLRMTSGRGDEVLISYDLPGRSFRIQVVSRGVISVDLLRESATRLTVTSSGGTTTFKVAFQSERLAGDLEVQVGSTVVVRDRMLMV